MGAGAVAADPQQYNLGLQLSGFSGANTASQPPQLTSIAPNVGDVLSFSQTDTLNVAPNELLLAFDGSRVLDPASFDGVRITRSGFDDDFTDGDEVVLHRLL